MFVPVSKPLIGVAEAQAVAAVMARGEISGFSGEQIQEFEKQFAAWCGVKHAVAVSSGTTALHLALVTLGIKAGDEVLVSTFTNMATVFAILYQGATPVAIDSEPRTGNMNPELLAAKITPRTKAIMPVHIYGHPVNMGLVQELARQHHLFIVEDAAEAHGAEYQGVKAGALGDVGCFSFYANKIVTTGEGGMVTTNNDEWAARARALKSLAFGTENKFMHQAVGFNYRMTNVQAAIGVAQMSKITEILQRKKTMAEIYLRELSGLVGLQLPVEESYARNVYWMFNVVLTEHLVGKRALIIAELKKRGVETREDFVPMNQQEIFRASGVTDGIPCPVADHWAANGFYLPSGTDITAAEQLFVAQQLREVLTAVAR